MPEFGPAALMELRVGLAALFLLPLALWRGKPALIARHWKAILVVGTLNSALPFLLYAYAAQSLGAGFLSVANAVTPVWGAVIGWLWLGDRLPRMRALGLLISLSGIIVLVWDKLDFHDGGTGPAVLAAISAPVFYGMAANWTKRYLGHVDALTNATGSMVAASRLAGTGAPGDHPLARTGGIVRGVARHGAAGNRLHWRGLYRVLPPDRPCRPDRRGQRDIPGAGVRRAMGRVVPGRSGDAAHPGRRRRDPGRHRAGAGPGGRPARRGSRLVPPRAPGQRHADAQHGVGRDVDASPQPAAPLVVQGPDELAAQGNGAL
ncbi:membrane protein [Bordetella pertussis]|nr:membrane protein [Bordetella pertussis]